MCCYLKIIAIKTLTVAMLAALTAIPLDAWAEEIMIENLTGQTIYELRFSKGVTGWQEDILKGSRLNPGAFLSTTSPKSIKLNLLAVFENSEYCIYYGLNLKASPYLRLWRDEAELFKWAPASKQAGMF